MRTYHVLIFIACVMACLAALCFVLPGRLVLGDKELKWPTFAEVMGTTHTGELRIETDTLVIDTTALPPDSSELSAPAVQPIIVPTVHVDSTTDSRLFLRSFYASLAQAGERKVRVVHYGDSQIEEDRMSSQIRKVLQDRFGGSGVGLMPLAQTIPSRSVKQTLQMNGRTITPQQGPQRYLVYGPKRMQRADGLYGPMGQVALMNDSIVSGS